MFGIKDSFSLELFMAGVFKRLGPSPTFFISYFPLPHAHVFNNNSLGLFSLCACFPLMFRCNIASLLTIALHGKLEYYTSIMKELLVDLIDASASKNPKLMLRRTESVVEKMLTNWMSICMYSYLKVPMYTKVVRN